MIKLYRLTTGEDLIAEQVEVTDTFTIAKKPFVLIPMQQPGAQTATIGFHPYIHYTKDEIIKIKSNNIICDSEPEQNILNAYQQNTSKILQAKKPNIIV